MAVRKKLYYPKSHITTGLYTVGKEWMLEDGTEYVGYYHTYIDGIILTEANYNQATSVTLIPFINTISQPNNRLYKSITTKKNVYTSPVSHFPTLTVDDYNNGFVTRYFVRRRNFSTYVDIVEINQDQYNSINKPNTGIDGDLYVSTTINWKLTGPLHDIKSELNTISGVFDTNQRLVHLKDNDLKGIKQFLTDYTELSIYSPYVSTDIKKLFGS